MLTFSFLLIANAGVPEEAALSVFGFEDVVRRRAENYRGKSCFDKYQCGGGNEMELTCSWFQCVCGTHTYACDWSESESGCCFPPVKIPGEVNDYHNTLDTDEYIGCYEDKNENRDLPVSKGQMSKTVQGGINAAPAACRNACKGYHYFGLQNENECFCGDAFGVHSRKPDRECGQGLIERKGQFVDINGQNVWQKGWYRTGRENRQAVYRGDPKFVKAPAMLACYEDRTTRMLPEYKGAGHDYDSCFTACAGWNNFGLQYYGQCWCGNGYGGTYLRVADSECGAKCASGNGICGTAWRNALYSTKPGEGKGRRREDSDVMERLPFDLQSLSESTEEVIDEAAEETLTAPPKTPARPPKTPAPTRAPHSVV